MSEMALNSKATIRQTRHLYRRFAAVLAITFPAVTGCATSSRIEPTSAKTTIVASETDSDVGGRPESLVLVGHRVGNTSPDSSVATSSADVPVASEQSPSRLPESIDSLGSLESLAVHQNPQLNRLAAEVQAARARTRHVDKLPDPKLGANIFTHPIETASGSQRANLSVVQLLPSLKRLNAQQQKACFEALALQQNYHAERLKIIGDVRVAWFRLYVLGKQIETTTANQRVLKSLIDVANANVALGKSAPGDVLLATVEYSRLEEQLLTLNQQTASTHAELNRLLGRDASHPVAGPNKINVALPSWSHEMLLQQAIRHQPAITSARIRTQATRWGIEVAELERRPDLSLNATWFAIDDNRNPSGRVDVGRDAWSLGAQVSIPIWAGKYDAIAQEARWKHAASHASVNDVTQRFDAVLRDLWEQAKNAARTAELYESTILPQARQTLVADQQAYINGSVEFDRVMRDFSTVLTLELEYHRSTGRLAETLARIRQAVGVNL